MNTHKNNTKLSNKKSSLFVIGFTTIIGLPLCIVFFLLLGNVLTSSYAHANAFTSLFSTKGYVPKAADAAVKELDKQLETLLGEHYPKTSLRIAFTVPVNINDFECTNTLARQMSEEIARGLKVKGYRVLEIRQGQEIIMTPEIGEFFLTRKQAELSEKTVETELLMTGTYAVTSRGVRFSIRLLHMDSTEVIAMATTTVPVYKELEPLLIENGATPPPPVLAPTTSTRLER